MRLVILALVLLLALTVAGCGAAAGTQGADDTSLRDDLVTKVASDDVEMEAAINTAKQSYGQFLDAFLDPQPGQSVFEVKAMFVEGGQAEHIWLADLDLSDSERH